ncbi:MAG: DUF1819 family protein [Chloroflexi bacterium]|nr:DUF1819 family protein [Chloroflexota bacterium]MBI3732790.1 DUF1819 family protein [Chloroflexota bacterium]
MVSITDEPRFTSRLIKASALLADTKTLLAAWDLSTSVADNLQRVEQSNIFGKTSRSRVRDILRIFRQRYFDDPDVGQALVALSQGHAPPPWLDPLLYFYSVQNDLLLRAIVTDLLYPRCMAGFTEMRVEQVVRAIHEWSAEGKTTEPWSEETARRVAQGAMATLRDFGILQGAVHKSITPIYLPTQSFAFIAFAIRRQLSSGERVLHSDEWKLFFLPVEAVERFFLEAHQSDLLSYQAAGTVIRLEFPAASLAEYADVLVKRTHQAA